VLTQGRLQDEIPDKNTEATQRRAAASGDGECFARRGESEPGVISDIGACDQWRRGRASAQRVDWKREHVQLERGTIAAAGRVSHLRLDAGWCWQQRPD